MSIMLELMAMARKDSGAVKIGPTWFNYKAAKFTNYRKV